MKIELRTGWILWSGEGVGWFLDEEEMINREFEALLPRYDGTDSQVVQIEILEGRITANNGGNYIIRNGKLEREEVKRE